MNILKKRTIAVNGIYEDGYTFGKLLSAAIVEELAKYGFTSEKDGLGYYICWKGKERFWIGARESTSQAAIRIALPFRDNSWGTTFYIGNIKASTEAEQGFSTDIAFFGNGDSCYVDINKNQHCSVIAMTLDGEESVVGIRDDALIVPYAETGMSNEKPWGYCASLASAAPSDPARCVVFDYMPLQSNGVVKYMLKDVALILRKAAVEPGQVITVDGEQYIYVFKNMFVKYKSEEA